MSQHRSLSHQLSRPVGGPSMASSSQSLLSSHRKATELTAQEYKEAIAFHAKQTTRQSPYPGQNFEDLDLFLQRSNPSPSFHLQAQDQPIPRSPLMTLYMLQSLPNIANTSTNNTATDRAVEHLNDPHQLTQLLRPERTEQAKSYVLFLAGYPTSDWLTTIGSLCHVDPEHYQRHLMFSPRQPYFSTPSLPSAAENIITLRLITIGCRHPQETSQDHVDQLRDDGARAMDVYRHALQLNREGKVKAGDSIVRRYSVHDETYFSIEQEVSVSLNYCEKQWVALVLLDAGNDLSESLTGPWNTAEDRVDFARSSRWKTTFLPTIRHRPKLALKSKKYTLPQEDNTGNRDLPQVASFLRRDYSRLLEWPVMKVDPFYALHELFELSASSELQFLNLVEEKIGPETSSEVLSKETPTLSNLLYSLEILQAHTRRLTENVERIKCRGSHQWPHAPDDTEFGKKAKDAASLLLRDYEFLLGKAQILVKRCERGMSVIMSNANIAESKRAMAQAKRVSKLTLLAYFYVPLSFTSSFFGMNFKQFSVGPFLGVWLWFVVSVPILLLSFIFYRWDISAMVRQSRRLQKIRQFWRTLW